MTSNEVGRGRANVRGDDAKASCRDGVLRIELPKAESPRAQRIAVHGVNVRRWPA